MDLMSLIHLAVGAVFGAVAIHVVLLLAAHTAAECFDSEATDRWTR